MMARRGLLKVLVEGTAAILSGCTAQSAPPKPVVSPLPIAFEAGWKGEQVCEPLFENAQVRAARCTFPPGVGHGRHFHPPHWGYIVEGATMRITTAAGTLDSVLKTGTNWWSDGIAWHEAVNVGSTTGVYIIVDPKQAK